MDDKEQNGSLILNIIAITLNRSHCLVEDTCRHSLNTVLRMSEFFIMNSAWPNLKKIPHEKEVTPREKILATHIVCRRLFFKMDRWLLEVSKANSKQRESGKGYGEGISLEEETGVVNPYQKRCPFSWLMGEMQVKTIMRCHFVCIWLAKVYDEYEKRYRMVRCCGWGGGCRCE